jgi:hypothetical protein
MDITIINLLSIVIGGIGIFGALTKFAQFEQHFMYLGSNNFQLKSDFIGKIRSYVFALLAIIGLSIQAIKEIFLYSLPERLYCVDYYIALFLLLLMVATVITKLLLFLSDKFAKRYWKPIIENSIYDAYARARSLLDNDGLYKGKVAKKPKTPDEEKKAYYIQNIKDIEINFKLLDIKYIEDDLSEMDNKYLNHKLATLLILLEPHLKY